MAQAARHSRFRQCSLSLDANGAGRDGVAVLLILGQAGVGARIGEHEGDNIVVAAGKRALVVAAAIQKYEYLAVSGSPAVTMEPSVSPRWDLGSSRKTI